MPFFWCPSVFLFDSQIITLRDYVPKIIGPESFKHYIGPYRGYNPSVDPSIANVFATAAFRFGHATISPILWRLNESFQEDERFPHLRLHNTLFSPWRIVKEGQCTRMRMETNNTSCKHSKHTERKEEEEEKILFLGQLQNQLHACSLKDSHKQDRNFCFLWKTQKMSSTVCTHSQQE